MHKKCVNLADGIEHWTSTTSRTEEATKHTHTMDSSRITAPLIRSHAALSIALHTAHTATREFQLLSLSTKSIPTYEVNHGHDMRIRVKVRPCQAICQIYQEPLLCHVICPRPFLSISHRSLCRRQLRLSLSLSCLPGSTEILD